MIENIGPPRTRLRYIAGAGRAPDSGGDGDRFRLRGGFRSSALGLVLIVLSPRGLAGLCPGENADALRWEMRRRFRCETIDPPDEDFERQAINVLAAMEGAHPPQPISLDLRGTPFQLRVWRALTGIPVGETVSYRDIARKIGAPGASRAVAGACAANPVAVIIPCHRVIRADGDMSGYRWGAARKAMLLARERSTSVAASGGSAKGVWPE